MSVEPGRVLGAYEVLSPLGAGGMGEVWRARHVRLGREIALKVLPEQLAQDSVALARFEREARAVAALSHPNVLAIHDYGEHDGVHFAAMELLEGETLQQRLAGGPLSWREVVDVGLALCDGLAAAHDKGIVHRDLKPENVFLTRSGLLKILDFGLATRSISPTEVDPAARTANVVVLTDPGMLIGTVAYMSPEQLRGEDADARSDLFALGCILYELLGGIRCFTRPSIPDTIAAILTGEPAPVQRLHLGLPAEVAQTVHRCLEKDRERRFQSAREVATALRTPAAMGPPPRERATTGVTSLAVLPFAHGGSDADTEYLADGVTENLINVFSRLRGVRVVPRTTAFRFRGRESEPELVGRELKVGAILSGKVVQRGDTLSVQAELVDTTEGVQLWGERYRRRMAELFDVEEELAREIAQRLKVHLSGQGDERIEQRRRGDPEAYRLYLEGRYHWNKRTPLGMEQALVVFEQAAARDPDFALAHAGIADCYSQLSHFGWRAPLEAYPRAQAAAEQALALEPELGEARASLAHSYACHHWDFTRAEAEFQQALLDEPGHATGHFWYAFSVLTPLGRAEDAARQMERALDLEPLSLAIRTYRGTVSYLGGWHEAAVAQARSALELEPRFPQALWTMAMAKLMQGDVAAALRGLHQAHEVSPWSQWVLAGLGHALGVAGRHEDARTVLAKMEERSLTHYMSPYLMAYVHVGLGATATALSCLEQAVEHRSDLLVFAKVDPVFDRLRSEPRMIAVLRQVGLLA